MVPSASPLTPTLSRGERERRITLLERPTPDRSFHYRLIQPTSCSTLPNPLRQFPISHRERAGVRAALNPSRAPVHGRNSCPDF